MSIQRIIDNASFITINKRKSVGQTISRSGHIKTAVQQPSLYRFTVGVDQGLTYSANRDLLQDLDNIDRNGESNVDIGSTNTGISYITSYQGGKTGGTLSINSYDGDQIYVDQTSVTGSGDLFKAGDFIQPLGNTSTYRYPYQVKYDVTLNTGSSNTIIFVDRPVLSQDGVSLTGSDFRLGSDVRFHLKALVMPTYSVIPHDRIGFSSDFELIEVLT